MKYRKNEKGQALVLIALGIVALVGFAALAIDGGMVFSDRRHAQNAADTAAMAGALAYARGSSDIVAVAQTRATSNGYDNDNTTNTVTVTMVDSPSTLCPARTTGKDITVDITSYVRTTFARVIGRTQMTNQVSATSRACGAYSGPPFNGNAIVSLGPNGVGYDGTGNPYWWIEGGGIFSNSSSSSAAYCNGATTIIAPSLTTVGNINLLCDEQIPLEIEGAGQYTYAEYSSLLPREPSCDGTAVKSGGQWHPQAGRDGSRVSLGGDMDFAPGLYCITNSPGPYHGELTGSDVTFYAMRADFELKFNGAGNSFTAQAPTTGEYAGVLFYAAPQFDANGNLLNTQAIDLRGNGDGDIVGTIIAPSADVTMFGNSGTGALNCQIIAYQVDAGGGADIHVTYNTDDNYQLSLPNTLTLLK